MTEDEVNEAQQAWCDGLVAISKAYKQGGDYTGLAGKFIDDLYDFQDGRVFFRPTLAMARAHSRPVRPVKAWPLQVCAAL